MTSVHLQGRPASPGFASGPLVILAQGPAASRRPIDDASSETAALRAAITKANSELVEIATKLTGEAREMIAFQSALLDDPAMSEAALDAIAQGDPADQAWRQALDQEIAGYEASEDEYFRARASDLADIRDRVLRHLSGEAAPVIAAGSVVLAEDLTPSMFLGTDWRDGGIALTNGSPTSHVAMLARARGVPMVVGVDNGIAGLTPGTAAMLDGAVGSLVLAPGARDLAEFERRRSTARAESRAAAAVVKQPAVTADGARIAVLLNIADPAELDDLDPEICDGIGLVRTELLFSGNALPDEDAQAAVYTRIAVWAAGRPVTIRTLDAGGDKPIRGLTLEGEVNPFLGVRGIRLTLRRRDVFKTQLRALARAAAVGNIEIMLPMVAVPREVEETRSLLAEACAELAREGVPHRSPPLGIMVEVPAVAIAPERFAADFFSIGSNDLVQYALAAGRDVASLADVATAADPAVLRLIANVTHHGRLHARKVSICGDAGGDPALIPLLLDAGLRCFSMAPSLVGRAKLAIAAYGRDARAP